MPDISGHGGRRPDAARRAYRRCARPLGLRALERMLGRGLPAQLAPALRVLLGDTPPARVQALSARLEHRREELRGRPDVYRYAYEHPSLGTTRWPDDPTTAGGEAVSLRWLASAASVPAEWGVFLHLCADAIGARTVLELGAGTGLSGAYLVAAPTVESLLTLEGSPPLARVAAQTLAPFGARATVVEGRFSDTLPRTLAALADAGRRVDLAYLDGHHEEAATLAYLDALRPHLRRGSLVVFDDIRLWQGMWRAWQRACALPGVAAAIDTGRFGVLVCDDDAAGAGAGAPFGLARYTGRWRVGPPRPQRSPTHRRRGRRSAS